MENHSETINNENKEIKKKVFDKVFDKFNKVFDKVFDKDFIELENTEEDLFESASRLFKDEEKLENLLYTNEDLFKKKLENLLYINEYLIKKRNKLRKEIYKRIIYVKDYSIFHENEHFLFQKAVESFKDEDEDEYQEFKKLANKYYNLSKLIQSIKFYTNNIKNQS